MSYNQHMKHWNNHRKDRFYQQCAPSLPTEKTLSLAMISEIYANSFHVEVDGKQISENFNDSDDAIDFYYTLSKEEQYHASIVDNIGIVIMR